MELAFLTSAAIPATRPRRRAPVAVADKRAKGSVARSSRSKTAGSEMTENEHLTSMLLRVASSQDRSAFAFLFEHFAPRIKAYMMRSGSDANAAEEFAQEAMLMVWRKAESFDPSQASVSTWIFTIARNKRIDAFRRTNRPELDPNDPLLQPEPAEMQDAAIEDLQTAQSIENAISDLPKEQIDILRLAFYEDKPHSEIAEVTGLPLGTVKSRLRLALGKLRGKLGDLEE